MATEPDPQEKCTACGHARCFHQIGTGNGVPVGQPFCDDRHDDPCACKAFVSEKQAKRDESERRLFDMMEHISLMACAIQSKEELFVLLDALRVYDEHLDERLSNDEEARRGLMLRLGVAGVMLGVGAKVAGGNIGETIAKWTKR